MRLKFRVLSRTAQTQGRSLCNIPSRLQVNPQCVRAFFRKNAFICTSLLSTREHHPVAHTIAVTPRLITCRFQILVKLRVSGELKRKLLWQNSVGLANRSAPGAHSSKTKREVKQNTQKPHPVCISGVC